FLEIFQRGTGSPDGLLAEVTVRKRVLAELNPLFQRVKDVERSIRPYLGHIHANSARSDIDRRHQRIIGTCHRPCILSWQQLRSSKPEACGPSTASSWGRRCPVHRVSLAKLAEGTATQPLRATLRTRRCSAATRRTGVRAVNCVSTSNSFSK